MNDSATPATGSESAPPRPRVARWIRLAVLFLLVGAGVAVWWKPSIVIAVARLVRGDDTDPAQRQAALEKIQAQDAERRRATAGGENSPADAADAADPANPGGPPDPANRDDEYRRLMLGRWTQSRDDAERELILEPDGTGLQVIRPKGWVATSYLGERVELDVAWKVENGRAIFHSVGGRPADKAARVNDLFGNHRDRRIVEITDERILLFDEKDQKPSEWKRAPAQRRADLP